MSDAFKGLYFREWKMMRGFFIGQFVVLVVMLFIPIGSNLTDKFLELLTLAPIIVPAAIMFSLNTEVNQMELFLHNPQSIHKLIFVKFVNGLVFALSFVFVVMISFFFIDLLWPVFDLNSFATSLYLLSFTMRLMISSIPFIALLLFLWTLHQVFRKYLGTLFSLVIVIAVLVVGTQLIVQVSHFDFYQLFTKWGAIELPHYRESSGVILKRNTIYLGNVIFYGGISAILYFSSTYLIDRKMEV